MQNTSHKTFVLPFVITFCIVTLFFSSDFYMPSLPNITEAFGVNDDLVQMSLTLFYVSATITGLIVGPMADQYGYRMSHLVCVGLSLAGTFMAVAYPGIETLLIGRFLAGCGAGGSIVLGFSVIQNTYDSHRATKIISTMGAFFSMAPMTYSVLGGYVDVHFGWRENLLALFCLNILSFFLSVFFYKIPGKLQHSVLSATAICGQYVRILSNKQFLIFGALIPLLFCGGAINLLVLPYYFVDTLGQSSETFGLCMALGFFACAVASMMNHKFLKITTLANLCFMGMCASVFGALLMLTTALFFSDSVTMIALSLMFFYMGWGISFAPSVNRALAPFAKNRGMASALRVGLLTTMGVVGATIGSLIPQDTLVPLSLIICALTGAALFLITKGKKIVA